MAASYNLSADEIRELFCEIIAKAENINLNSFYGSNELLKYYTGQFTSIDRSHEFASRHFSYPAKQSKLVFNEATRSKILVKEAVNGTKESDLMYNLSNAIRTNKPHILTPKKLLFILEYLDKKNNYNLFKDYDFNDKIRHFDNTHWLLYYYNEVDEITSERAIGISSAILTLLPFGKAEILRRTTSNDELQKYTGAYTLDGDSNEYLRLSLKTEADTRALRMEFYIGELTPLLAIGTYTNNYNFMLCGAALIERVIDKNILKIINSDEVGRLIKFFNSGSNDYKNLDNVILEFFKKYDSRIIVPKGKSSRKELLIWLNQVNR